MTKKISKVIVYYEDGTYEEITNNVLGQQSAPNKKIVETGPLTQPTQPWVPYTWYVPSTGKNPWDPPFTVTCDFSPSNKYTITSTSNGYNVGTSR